MLKRRNLTGIALSVAVLMAPQAYSEDHLDSRNGIRHVLLISIDGMHALDYENCVKGGYCPNLAALARNGVNYTRTSTSRPSDSFPGLMALVTGGTPRSVGAFYDVAYDRWLHLRELPATESPAVIASPTKRTAQRLNTKKASNSTSPSSTAAVPTARPTTASSRSTPRDCLAIRLTTASRFTPGISSEPTPSTESSMPRAAIQHGPISTRSTPPFPAPQTTPAMWTTITPPRSIPMSLRCLE